MKASAKFFPRRKVPLRTCKSKTPKKKLRKFLLYFPHEFLIADGKSFASNSTVEYFTNVVFSDFPVLNYQFVKHFIEINFTLS